MDLLLTLCLAASPPAPVRLRAGEAYTVRAPAGAPAAVQWFVLQPRPEDASNAKACGTPPAPGCHAPLHFQLRRLPALEGRRSFPLAEVPALAAAGTHRLLAAGAGDEERVVGEEALAFAQTVVIREGDDYLGYLSELLGVPFVFWPTEVDGVHQTDARLAADCVSTVLYGRRREGCALPWYGPGVLPSFMASVPDGAAAAGDVLTFGFQTAVLAKDTPPLGQVDAGDLVIHAWHGVVERVPFGTLAYRGLPYRVLRWRGCPVKARAP